MSFVPQRDASRQYAELGRRAFVVQLVALLEYFRMIFSVEPIISINPRPKFLRIGNDSSYSSWPTNAIMVRSSYGHGNVAVPSVVIRLLVLIKQGVSWLFFLRLGH